MEDLASVYGTYSIEEIAAIEKIIIRKRSMTESVRVESENGLGRDKGNLRLPIDVDEQRRGV